LNIVIFGLTLSSSWGNGHATPYRAILRALWRMGHRVTFYEKDVPYYALHRDFSRCDFCGLVLYRNWADVSRRAIRDVRRADVVINASYCPEGARIIDETRGDVTGLRVFYDLDTPITLSNLSRGDVDYLRRDQVIDFDLYLSFTGGQILRELETEWGARMARPLYGCVDPDIYQRVPEQARFRCLLSYMGTYAADRQDKFDQLFLEPTRQLPNQQFVLAGSLYPWEWHWPENVRYFEHVSPGEHPAFYSSSRFTLNITRGDMARGGYCPSGRFFEAAACGAPIISDWFDGLDSFFLPGREIVIASQPEEVRDALQMSEQERLAMAKCARERTLAEHTGERRAQQLLEYLQEAGRRATVHQPRTISMEASS